MSKLVSGQKAILQLASRLIQAAKSTHLSDDTLKEYLRNLKMQYVAEMKSQQEEWITVMGDWGHLAKCGAS